MAGKILVSETGIMSSHSGCTTRLNICADKVSIPISFPSEFYFSLFVLGLFFFFFGIVFQALFAYTASLSRVEIFLNVFRHTEYSEIRK